MGTAPGHTKEGGASAKGNELMGSHHFTFTHLLKMMAHYWQWFLLSVVICVCAAQLYVLRVTPAYRISGRLLISQADKYRRASYNLLKSVDNVSTVSNTTGVENEVEVLWSSVLMHDVVKSLKLYTEYWVDDWPKKRPVYATQPVNVDLDPVHLDSIDNIMFEDYCSIVMKLGRKSDADSTILVMGALLSDGESVWTFRQKIKSLPAAVDTPYGTLTFTENPHGEPLRARCDWTVTIDPPMNRSYECLGQMGADQMEARDEDDDRWLMRYYYKKSGIVKLTYIDTDIRRGMDIIRQIAVSYNKLANSEKNQRTLGVDAFINERLAILGEELSQRDNSISAIKRSDQLTSLADAARMSVEADRYGSQLVEAEARRQMLGYLEAYVGKPENRYGFIPSNMGLVNQVTEKLIGQYNTLIQERNRLLLSASEADTIQSLLFALPDADLKSLMQTCLSHAEILLPAGGIPVFRDGCWGLPELEFETMTCFRLTQEVLAWTLQDFFPEGGRPS